MCCEEAKEVVELGELTAEKLVQTRTNALSLALSYSGQFPTATADDVVKAAATFEKFLLEGGE